MQISLRLAAPGLLLAVFLLPAGAQQKGGSPSSPFFPLRVGNQWRYNVTVGDAPPQKMLITVDKEEPYEHKVTKEDKTVAKESVLRYTLKSVSGSKELHEHVALLKEGVCRFSTAGKAIDPPLLFFKLPPGGNDKWSVNSTSENIPLTGTFTTKVESVKVPAGEFQALHVSSQDFQLGTEKMMIDYWFAQNVGMVKEHVHVGNSDVIMELEEFKTGK